MQQQVGDVDGQLEDEQRAKHDGNVDPRAPSRRKRPRIEQRPSDNHDALGDEIRLERVTETVEMDNEAMAYLAGSKFITVSVGKVRTKAPDGTMSLSVGRETVAVGAVLSSNLYVALV